MYWGNGMDGWDYVLMALMMVLFWGLLITGIVLVARYLGGDRRQPAPPSDGSDPKRLLEERFARGEIDEDEYRQREKVLGGA
jgi:putative membrane protein